MRPVEIRPSEDQMKQSADNRQRDQDDGGEDDDQNFQHGGAPQELASLDIG